MPAQASDVIILCGLSSKHEWMMQHDCQKVAVCLSCAAVFRVKPRNQTLVLHSFLNHLSSA